MSGMTQAELIARLAEIEARCNAATAGPWLYKEGTNKWSVGVGLSPSRTYFKRLIASGPGRAWHPHLLAADKADVAFIAHARDDIPWLIAALKARAAGGLRAGGLRAGGLRAGGLRAGGLRAAAVIFNKSDYQQGERAMFGSVRDPEFWGGVIVVCVAALISGVVGGFIGGWVPFKWFVAGLCP